MPIVGGISNALNAAMANPSPILGAWDFFVYLFTNGGWIVFLVIFLSGARFAWVYYIENEYDKTRRWVMLAIDVPKDNVQSPKAVENIFAHLAGAHGSKTLQEKYWIGNTQDWFSFEIISIGGYVQFIIRTIVQFRDLVESAIYAQYPDAVITEIEDYTTGYPSVYPHEHYDLYGTEFALVEDQALPIRTYLEFEHTLTQEFKDPLSALLETMGKLGDGEQLWLQIIIVPIDDSWKKNAIALIKKMIGEKQKKKNGLAGALLGELSNIGQTASPQITGAPTGPQKTGSRTDDLPSRMLYLSPYDKERVEAISRKIKKIGFLTKIRSVYIAPKENFVVQHGREALIGTIKQFNTSDLNSIKPDTKHVGVHAHYFFIDWRKNIKKTKVMIRYKNRSVYRGRNPFVLNIEELASIWHFPQTTETVPIRHMVQKTEFKRIAPPSSVPFAEGVAREPAAAPKMAPPPNIPLG